MGINWKFNYHKLGLERFTNCALRYVRLKSWKKLYLYKLTFYHGCSARFVIQAILAKRKVWQEIQNLYMRFVIYKVRNTLQCTEWSGPLYIILCLWDELGDHPLKTLASFRGKSKKLVKYAEG